METLAGIREFCENNSQLRAKWRKVASIGLQIHIFELENALHSLHGRTPKKNERLYLDFRSALFELRERCAKFGISVSDTINPENISELLR